MPDDLDDLASRAEFQDRWKTARWNNSLADLADQQSMTHQPEQPNPAAPYLQSARDLAAIAQRFGHGGLTEAFPGIKDYIPAPIQRTGELFQSQAARDALSSANAGAALQMISPAGALAGAVYKPRFADMRSLRYYNLRIPHEPHELIPRLWGDLHGNDLTIEYNDNWGSNGLNFRGNLYDKGQKIGKMDRSLYLDRGRAYQASMDIGDDFQGLGYSKRILGKQLHLYPELGINYLDITAVGEGAQQWGNHGYIPEPHEWKGGVKPMISHNYTTKDLGYTAQEKYVIDKALNHPNPKAMWLINDLKRKVRTPDWTPGMPESTVGRELLESSDWTGGFSYLDPQQVRRANRYLKDYLPSPLKEP